MAFWRAGVMAWWPDGVAAWWSRPRCRQVGRRVFGSFKKALFVGVSSEIISRRSFPEEGRPGLVGGSWRKCNFEVLRGAEMLFKSGSFEVKPVKAKPRRVH